MNRTNSRSQGYIQILGLSLFFLILTIIAGRNVVFDLDNTIIGRDSDVFINPWANWWTSKALNEPETSLWHTDFLFYPEGANLTFHSFSHLNTLLSLALQPIVGSLPAYNLVILLNYFLASLTMFALARYLTGSFGAALIASIIFAFNSHNLYQSAHPVLISVWCVPLMTLFLMRAVEENKAVWSVLAAVSVFLGAASSALLLIMMGMWATILIAYMFLNSAWPNPSWRNLLIFSGISLISVIILQYPLLVEAICNRNSSFIVTDHDPIESDIFTPLVPPWYIWFSRGIYLGFVPFFLVTLTLGRKRKEAAIWIGLFLGSYLLTIGPEPQFLGRPLGIELPWSNLIVPILRQPHRLNVLASLGLAMMGAYGWLAMTPELDHIRKPQLIAIMSALLIFVDYAAIGIPYTPIEVSPFYTDFLQNAPDDQVLAILPFSRMNDKKYMYYQSLHNHRMTGGVISRAEAETFSYIQKNPLLKAGSVVVDPLPPVDPIDAINQLNQDSVTYVVLDKEFMDVEPWRDAIMIDPIYEDQYLIAYSTNIPPDSSFNK